MPCDLVERRLAEVQPGALLFPSAPRRMAAGTNYGGYMCDRVADNVG